tara:strand:+ start:16899 stop:18101 length:1203 start_codon:yes stop_codon:yes gene_type:complete
MRKNVDIQKSFDLAVVGCGIIGTLAALLAVRKGLNVVLFGPKEGSRPDGADSRAYAISPQADLLFNICGLNREIDRLSEKITGMEIFHQQHMVDLNAREVERSYLARIITHHDLLNVCQERLSSEEFEHIKVKPNKFEVSQIENEQKAKIYYGQNSFIFASLVLGADGLNSWCRYVSGLDWGLKSYHQVAIVATLETPKTHKGIARQWFTDKGIIAFLPMRDNIISLVWSVKKELADSLIASKPEEFLKELENLTSRESTTLRLVSKLSSASLAMLHTDACAAERLVLIGDAAHTVHPLAGFGLNLGIFDILDLLHNFERFERGIKSGKSFDVGQKRYLSEYERKRRNKVKFVQIGLDSINWFFSPTKSSISVYRKFGMLIFSRLNFFKKLAMKIALSRF